MYVILKIKAQFFDWYGSGETVSRAITKMKNWTVSIPISVPALQEKALELHEPFNIEEFKTSTEWLVSSRHRLYVKCATICGESASDKLEEKASQYRKSLLTMCYYYRED